MEAETGGRRLPGKARQPLAPRALAEAGGVLSQRPGREPGPAHTGPHAPPPELGGVLVLSWSFVTTTTGRSPAMFNSCKKVETQRAGRCHSAQPTRIS